MAQRLIAELIGMFLQFLWVPINDRLPDLDGEYLTSSDINGPEFPHLYIAGYTKRYGWSFLSPQCVKAITHWMPLPKPPKRTKNESH